MSIGCTRVLLVIQSYVDGECDIDTAMVVAEHLDVCSGCVDQATTFRWLKSALQREEVVDPEVIGRLYTFAGLLTRRRVS